MKIKIKIFGIALVFALLTIVTLAARGDIAAGSITADRLNVSTLSAISADLGTVTAGSITGGTIDGATVRAGSGDEVTLDASGISIAGGSSSPNQVKWASGAAVVYYSGSTLTMATGGGSSTVLIDAGGGTAQVQLNAANNRIELNSGGVRIGNLAGSGTNYVCSDTDGDIFASATICAPPAPEVAALREEVAALRAEVAHLIASQR